MQSMNKFLKDFWYTLVSVIAIFGITLVVLMFQFSGATSCGKNSESVTYAKTLPKERLGKLYYDIEKLALSTDVPYSELKKNGEGIFPEPFSDIQAVRIRPKEENIMLNGCFDHYVYLSFHGLESNKKFYPKRQIVLSWGEHEGAGSEVIWSE